MAKINENECVGCGMCSNICPEGIEMVDGIAKIKNENAECLKNAADACPEKCIILNDIESEEPNKNINVNSKKESWQGRGMGAGRGKGLGRGPKDGRGSGFGGGGRRRG